MDIRIINTRSIKLSSGAENKKPTGWEGEVPDHIAQGWIEDGDAEYIGGGSDSVSFTPDEKLALKHIAGEVLQNAALAEMTLDDLSFEQMVELAPDFGIVGAADMDQDTLYASLETALNAVEEETEVNEQIEEPQDNAQELDLEDLSYDELVEFAENVGIEKPRMMKKQALLDVLNAKAEENAKVEPIEEEAEVEKTSEAAE